MSIVRACGSIAGGSLVLAGAILPWLTLDSGLQSFGGTTGVYGWLVVAAGTLAVAGGVRELVAPARWILRASGALGVILAVFALWLLAGVDQFVHRQDAAMLVPGAGPGLYLVLAGAAAIFTFAVVLPKTERHELWIRKRPDRSAQP